MYRDILVPLMNTAGSESSPRKLAASAAMLRGAVTALGVEIDFAQPVYMYADAVAFMYDAFRDAERINDEFTEALVREFEAQAAAAAVTFDAEIVRAAAGDVPGLIARRARRHDLTLFIAGEHDVYQRQCIEAAIFGSGRPVLVLPPEGLTRVPETIVVAWDYSRECSRAFADALPVVRQARTVTVLHVSDDGASSHLGAPGLRRHLGRLGIDARYKEVYRGTLSVSQTIAEQLDHERPDLLVMGAYGHSRTRELVLGGVTRTMMRAPSLPVLMSH